MGIGANSGCAWGGPNEQTCPRPLCQWTGTACVSSGLNFNQMRVVPLQKNAPHSQPRLKKKRVRGLLSHIQRELSVSELLVPLPLCNLEHEKMLYPNLHRNGLFKEHSHYLHSNLQVTFKKKRRNKREK
eukprot:UN24306